MSVKALRTIVVPQLLFAVLLAACSDRNVPSAEPARRADAPVTPTMSSAEISVKCSPALTPEQCAEANSSLRRDADALVVEMSAQSQANAAREKATAAQMPDPGEIKRQECDMLKATLAALQRRQSRPPGEIISKEEADGIPAEIAKAELRISKDCR
jgi:hypothetical protein